MTRLAVVIPALNEEASIGKVVTSVVQRGATVIVVNDGSSDKTAEIAKAAGAIIIQHEKNRGYEPALTSGVHAAHDQGFEIAATFDADGQLDPDDLIKFMRKLDQDQSDLVVGMRDYRNRYCEYLLAWFGQFRFGLVDPLCGLKMYRLNKAKKYFPFDTCRLVGMELALKMIADGCKFSQMPIHVKKREGESRYGSSLKGEIFILKSLFKVFELFGMK